MVFTFCRLAHVQWQVQKSCRALLLFPLSALSRPTWLVLDKLEERLTIDDAAREA